MNSAPPGAPTQAGNHATRSDDALGTEPVQRLLIRLAAPAMFSMFVNALYNLVDAIFVGRADGPVAIAALAIAFPVQQIILAVALMIGQGGASIVSRSLGAGNREDAARTAGTAFALSMAITALVSLVALRRLDTVLVLFGATGEIMEPGTDYLSFILLTAPLLSGTIVANNMLRAEGNPKAAMVIILTGAVLNILLDPVLIFLLRMGIRGAAIATAISQTVAFLLAFWFFAAGRSGLQIRWRHLVPRVSLARDTLTLGIPVFIRQAANSVIATLINNMLAIYGTAVSIAVYGTINRLLIFMFMPMFGMIQAFQPVVGYNFGAQKLQRVRQTVSITVVSLVGYGSIAAGIMFLFPAPLFRLFTTDTRLVEEGIPALRFIVAMLPFIGVQIVGAGYFQSTGHARPAIILGLLRQVLLLIPLVVTLPLFLGVTGIWIAFPASDLVATAVTALVLIRGLRRDISTRQITQPVAQ